MSSELYVRKFFSEKLTLSWAGGKNNISVRAYRTCAYPGVRNVSFRKILRTC